MLNINFILPFSRQRAKKGSGAGVPMILRSHGLGVCEGHSGSCYNVPIKTGSNWNSTEQITTALEKCFSEVSNTDKNFVLTRLNLGPLSMHDEEMLEIISALSLPTNVKLNGVWSRQLDTRAPFVLAVMDLRRDKGPVNLTDKFGRLLAKQASDSPIILDSNSISANLQNPIKYLQADYDNDGRVAGRLLNYIQIQLASAAAILCDESTHADRKHQLEHWCQLYHLPYRTIRNPAEM
ncbi:hypothetical protein J4N45_11020 [Vibrio sp. SCSIO 43140]|uniref:hypothetical protein n=1 Tax=Vibrio sp. SCSIO 43140 TaxID=2819100 RepID=UPI00207633D5|nr:hypothetical protein [Vibrio sp. SCSIO 43140]USD59062.1 hypothetical protein J4N45_11020 [Vibrio sp. SCSIO 43140]